VVTLTDKEGYNMIVTANKLAKQQQQVKSQINKLFKEHIWITATGFFKHCDVAGWHHPDTYIWDKDTWQYWFRTRQYPPGFDTVQVMKTLQEQSLPLVEQYVKLGFDIYHIEQSNP
jgi:hypothetical protein